ncbi:MAG: GAF domain-containing protein [Chloroflexi bacterium]|nr:GAF domain-containing protein [Chloroflexota bacterium]
MMDIRALYRVTHVYINPLDLQRARGLLLMAWVFIIGSALTLLLLTLPTVLSGEELLALEILYFVIVPPVTIITSIVVLFLVQSGRLRLAARLFVVYHLVNIAPHLFNGLYTSLVAAMLVPVVAAGTLLSRRGILATFLIVVGILSAAAVRQGQLVQVVTVFPAAQLIQDVAIAFGVMLISLLYLYLFTGNINLTIRELLDGTTQVAWLTEIGGSLGSVQDEEELLQRALSLVRDRFDYDYARLYLINEQEVLVPRASTALGGQNAEETYSLTDACAVSVAARTQQPTLVSNQDYPARRTHFQPSTRSGVTLPLIVEHRVIGVLDIQNDENTAFYRSTLTILMLLAAEVANALHYLRNTAILKRKLQEQEEVTTTLRLQLLKREGGGVNSISTVWDRYLGQRGQEAFGFDVHRDLPLPMPASDLPETMRPTLAFGELSVNTEGEEQIISLPIKIGEQVLGAMSFAVAQQQALTQRQIDMAQSVADRLALALDNTRLLEQTQAQALRERKANEAGSLLISANDVNTLLDMAAETFNAALGAIFTRIYIQPDVLTESANTLPSNGASAHPPNDKG